MKRDMDLARAILRQVEADKPVEEIPEHTQEDIYYHIALLKDAGFVDATVDGDMSSAISFAFVSRLTWQGHDFLDASRNDTLWRKAREHVIKPAASWTFSLLLEWLKQEAHRRIFGVPESSGS